MAVDKTFLIPAPSGSIDVVIKDSDNITVFSDTVDNDPFIVSLDAGDYVLYATYGSSTNGWCFSVQESCVCPTLDSITHEMGVSPIFYGYAFFHFDMTAGFSCPFVIDGGVFSGLSGIPFAVTINSLADFDGNVGSIYYKTIWIGGTATSINYRVVLPATSAGEAVICDYGTYGIECNGPDVYYIADLSYNSGAGQFELTMAYNACGDDCQDITINYRQIVPSSSTADSGSYTETAPCPSGVSPTPHVLSPSGASPTTSLQYEVSWVDCCGNSGTILTNLWTP